MEKKINIAELLKDCPRGMELDCTLFDDVKFEECAGECIYIRLSNGKEFALTEYGNCLEFPISKCIIFPKDKTTWEGFVPPRNKFKDGDIVSAALYPEDSWIGIFMQYGEVSFTSYCCLNAVGVFSSTCTTGHSLTGLRYATEEEKQKLFDVIKANGYKWNAETKTLEKLVKPKFKVGDRIKHIVGKEEIATIVGVTATHYNLDSKVGTSSFTISLQREWELVPNKFDITTLKPFDKVLVRLTNNCVWMPKFFYHYDTDPKRKYYPFITTDNIGYVQCIPYKGNEHLCRTINDCSNFYKNW